MGAIHLAIFILTSLRAVGGFAQTPHKPHKPSESLVAYQALALQERNTGPALAQVSPKADDSPYRDPPDETQSIALPSWSSVETISKPDLILSSNALCSSVNHPTTTTGGKLKRRGVKQRRGATPNPELFCPLPAAITTTDTDTGPSKIDGQRPQTEKGQEQGPTPPDGLPQPEEFKWPNLLKIPTDDGDSPACFEATNGLMPVGVCENPEQRPEPSRWDVFMQFNRYFNPRAWKLLDSTLGAFFFLSVFFHANLDHSIFHLNWINLISLTYPFITSDPSLPPARSRKISTSVPFSSFYLIFVFDISSLARNAWMRAP